MDGRVLGINRLRVETDGPGVTTLVALQGCPLKCKYCLNAHSQSWTYYTVQDLYESVKIDSLYFDYTGGGICFGGHEPLIQSEFITNFIKYVKSKELAWRFGIETSLNVKDLDIELISLIDYLIIDIKDINNSLYKAYTGLDNQHVIYNLNLLKSIKDLNKSLYIKIRLPMIPGYNTFKDRQLSRNYIESLGIADEIDEFIYDMNRGDVDNGR